MNIRIRVIVLGLLFSMTMFVSAQVRRLVVVELEGKAEYIANGHKYPLQKGVTLTEETVLYVPFKGKVVVIDQAQSKEYTIQEIGWASIENKLKGNRNTVAARTKDYVSSILAQVTNNKKIKGQYVSDPATVTRDYYTDSTLTEVKGSKSVQGNAFVQDYYKFKMEALKEYNDFRKKALSEYAAFVRSAWKQYGAEPPVEMPKEQEVEPVLVPDADQDTESWFSNLFRRKKNRKKKQDSLAKENVRREEAKNKELRYKDIVSVPTFEDVAPLYDVKDMPEMPEEANNYMSFRIFGTECRVRIGDNCRFRLRSCSNVDVADAIELFNKTQFNNMLYDCLEMRDKYQMSDWTYYQMLLTLTNLFYGKDSNEGALVLGFLYSQSGYKMRLATDGQVLQTLVASKHIIYNKKFYHMDGDNYYMLDGRNNDILNICEAKFRNEGSLSLQMSAVQKLSVDPAPERTIASKMNEDFSFTVCSNKNYMDFFDTYPASCFDGNFMTRWAMYANTPLEEGMQKQLYPAMREKLRGLSKRDAVQQLLYWVQTGFEYGYDDEIWGCDRAFFGEESIFYPYCDCEDRSILLSRLVRDLLGLKTILIYYPGHLAMGVGFEQDEEGDYIMLDGQKFIVCDPTYIPSKVGQTMPHMNNEEATVILLN